MVSKGTRLHIKFFLITVTPFWFCAIVDGNTAVGFRKDGSPVAGCIIPVAEYVIKPL